MKIYLISWQDADCGKVDQFEAHSSYSGAKKKYDQLAKDQRADMLLHHENEAIVIHDIKNKKDLIKLLNHLGSE